MKENSRRDFLKGGATLGAAAISASLAPSYVSASSKPAHQNRTGSKVRILGSGKNTIKVNYGLGLGCMGMSWNRSFVPRPTLPRYKPDAVIANWKIIDALTTFGNKRGVTPAQIALAWLSAQKPWVVPIPGTTKLAHLQENLWSSDFQFTSDELATFTADITAIPITGERYPTPQTK